VGSDGHKESCVRWGPAVLRDVAMATNFWTQFAIADFVGYNFGCMIASDTQFDSRDGFSGSSYPMKARSSVKDRFHRNQFWG